MRSKLTSVAVLLGLLLGAAAPGCAGRRKQAAEAKLLSQPAEALYQRALEQLSRGRLRQARAALERIQYESEENRQELEPLARLAVADSTFYEVSDLSMIDARNLYLDFVTLYGNHPLAPYAQLQAGLCSLRQVNHPSKDQSLTEQAIADLTEVVRRYPASTYAAAARDLLGQAHSRLAESEFLIGEFYVEKKAYGAAVERFRQALQRFPDYGQKDKLLFHLARALRRNHNDVEGRFYLDQLMTDYPDSSFADEARKELESAGDGQPAPQPGSEP